MNNLNDISIGLAMIARDEEENIARAINSAKDICSQIVVVDTGSSDRTPEISSNLGAEVHFIKWKNNFSEARNVAIAAMRTDWILVLDADEEIDNDSFFLNLDLLTNNSIGGINLLIINEMDTNNQQKSKHRYTRLFRNFSGIRFEGSIHEQIRPSIEKAGLSIVKADIIIHHYGYINTSDDKKSRNLKLLQEEIAQNPQDDWLKYHLATTEFSMGNLDKSEKIFLEIVDSPQLSREQHEMTLLRLAQINLNNNNLAELIKYINFRSEDTDREGLRIFILAAAKMMDKKFAEALNLYQNRLLQQSDLVDKKIVAKAITTLNSII